MKLPQKGDEEYSNTIKNLGTDLYNRRDEFLNNKQNVNDNTQGADETPKVEGTQ